MSYQVFFVTRPPVAADEQISEEIAKKEHFKTKQRALARVQELLRDKYTNSILLARGPHYILSEFQLRLKLDGDGASE